MTTALAPRLTFDELQHEYRLDGVVIPSVTSILRSVNLINFDHIPVHILTDAQARGRRVHAAAHFLAEGDLFWPDVLDEDQGYVESAAQYLESLGTRERTCEVRVWHEQYKYAGTFDVLVWPSTPGGIWTLGDFKTGNPADACSHLQLAGYEAALRSMFDSYFPRTAPLERVSIGLKKDGGFPALERYTDAQDFPKFLAALTILNEQKAIRGKRWNG